MSSLSFKLEPQQWALVRALEFGAIDMARLDSDLARLKQLELVEAEGTNWRLTEYGLLLSASRRTI